MELPIIEPAPVVAKHAVVFRDLFENQCQFRHFQHYLTGLIVLPTKEVSQNNPSTFAIAVILTSASKLHALHRNAWHPDRGIWGPASRMRIECFFWKPCPGGRGLDGP
jgi:hypothetical protein